uniref:ZopR2 n=1 Tax=Diffractella curvata TaxID=2819868 RepID=A0A8A5D5K0_9PEZI|nr:ZopR2 [Diffractella curvata]
MSQDQSRAVHTRLGVDFRGNYVAIVEVKCSRTPDAELDLALKRLLEYLSQDSKLRVIIIAVGKDDSALAFNTDSNTEVYTETTKEKFRSYMIAPLKCNTAIISVLHGICTKLALDIACGSDIRICTSNARFLLGDATQKNTSLEAAMTEMPPAVLTMDGASVFREMLMSGGAFVAQDAHRMEFVSSVSETMDEAIFDALRLAESIAQSTARIQKVRPVNYTSHGQVRQPSFNKL